jgi:hypothetical protein
VRAGGDLTKLLNHLHAYHSQLVKQFIAGRLPVPLSPQEEACTAAGAPLATIFPYTQLRMLRPGLATAVVEDGKLVVYHCMDNSRCVSLLSKLLSTKYCCRVVVELRKY